jgi:cytochrome c oxidase assembly protein subunit 15
MNITYNQSLHRYAIFLAVCTFLLLIAGALVTSNDAALSVPDWPLSFGSLTPPMVGGVRYEHTHRVIAAVVGLLTIIFAILLWRREKRAWMRNLGFAAVGAVIAQGVLGGLTVLLFLHYGMPVAHACLAQIFFGLIVSLAVFTSRWWTSERLQLDDRGTPSIHVLASLTATVIFLQVVLGAGFRHRDIPIWPHAIGAFIVLGVVIWTAVTLKKRFGSSLELSRVRMLLHAIVGIQILLGLAAWWARTAADAGQTSLAVLVSTTVTHTVVGALLFALSIVVALVCYRLVPRSREVAATAPRQVSVG